MTLYPPKGGSDSARRCFAQRTPPSCGRVVTALANGIGRGDEFMMRTSYAMSSSFCATGFSQKTYTCMHAAFISTAANETGKMITINQKNTADAGFFRSCVIKRAYKNSAPYTAAPGRSVSRLFRFDLSDEFIMLIFR